jgi:hypothetical protein
LFSSASRVPGGLLAREPWGRDQLCYQRWPWVTLLDRLDSDGPIVRDLGQQWVVMVAAQWNENFRERMGQVTGRTDNGVKDPVFADINRMRNDIIHHGGIASQRNTGRCEELCRSARCSS